MLSNIAKLCAKRRLLYSLILGGFAGLFLTLGRAWEFGGSLKWMGIGSLLRIVAYSVLFTALNYVLLSKITIREENTFNKEEIFSRRWFFILWLGIFLCWIPVFLAYYPTIWAYDVGDQVPVIRGNVVTNHHPLLHTLYLETVVRIGSKPGDYELGMTLLSLTQMLGLSGMFSYGIEYTRRWGSGKWCRVILFCFFAFLPFNSILSISMTKDVLFSGCWMVCSLKLYDMIDNPEKFFHSKKKLISFALFLCIMLSLRSNAVYAFVAAAILGIFVLQRNWRKQFALLCLAGLFLYGGFQSCLFHIMKAEKGYSQEAFCIPMQCLVGTAIRHQELIPEYGTGQLLMEVIPRDWFTENLESSYDPHLVDPVKMRWWLIGRDEFDPVHLIKVWISYGMKYPADYLDIWGTLTLGAWYPFDETHARIYDNYEPERQGYLLTDYRNVPEMAMERPASKWPGLERIYEKVATENVHQRIPVISLLFAPATYCWIMFFALFLALYQRRYQELLPLGMLFLYWGTVLMGPTVVVRYLYPVMVTMPFILCRLTIRRYQPIE